MNNFLPHTDADRQTMLTSMGLLSVDELFKDIPTSLREKATYHVVPKEGLSEYDLEETLKILGEKNKSTEYACFLGGGAYARHVPMAVNTLASRSEFATAYTPYQPEVSQGTLQVVYEFQSMMAELTGMDAVNASVYDAGSAVTEAAFMAVRITKRHRFLVANSLNPDYQTILNTYTKAHGQTHAHAFDPTQGPEALNSINPKEFACLVLQHPNYFGSLEQLDSWTKWCRSHGILFIVASDPIALALLKPPGAYGADMVVGDIQPLGNHLAYGGPYGGYIATKKQYVRQLPGRLVGRTLDIEGRSCFTLTLQTREQHIRREKATSNICTNQSLNILKATVYLTLLGPQGLKQLANLSVQRAHTLAQSLNQLPGIKLLFPNQPFFSEFAITLPDSVESVLAMLENHRILGGIPLKLAYPQYPNGLLISTTEKTTLADIRRYTQAMSDFFSPKVTLHPEIKAQRPLQNMMECH